MQRRKTPLFAFLSLLCLCAAFGSLALPLMPAGTNAAYAQTVYIELAATPDADASPTLCPAPAETPIPTETPAPTETPVPTETPIPTETPVPTEADTETAAPPADADTPADTALPPPGGEPAITPAPDPQATAASPAEPEATPAPEAPAPADPEATQTPAPTAEPEVSSLDTLLEEEQPAETPTAEPQPTEAPTETPTEAPPTEPPFEGTVSIRLNAPAALCMGDTVELAATLHGYDGISVRLQWQFTRDGASWTDAEGANGYTHTFTVDERTAGTGWRLCVTVI